MLIENDVLEWTLICECPVSKSMLGLLSEDEEIITAYKTFRDCAIFTDKRIIIKDAFNYADINLKMYSLPYKSIIMWATDDYEKMVDMNSELELYTVLGKIIVKVKKEIKMKKLCDILIHNINEN